MKILSFEDFTSYILYPTLGGFSEDLFAGGHKGLRLEMNTGFTYLKGNEERGNWIGLSILGFGLGFYWGI